MNLSEETFKQLSPLRQIDVLVATQLGWTDIKLTNVVHSNIVQPWGTPPDSTIRRFAGEMHIAAIPYYATDANLIQEMAVKSRFNGGLYFDGKTWIANDPTILTFGRGESMTEAFCRMLLSNNAEFIKHNKIIL